MFFFAFFKAVSSLENLTSVQLFGLLFFLNILLVCGGYKTSMVNMSLKPSDSSDHVKGEDSKAELGTVVLEFSEENKELEKKIRRKFDFTIVLIVTGIFLLAFIDRYVWKTGGNSL